MTERSKALLDRQIATFRTKFGRDPGLDDPVFFDLNADEPCPLDSEAMERATVEAMAEAGIAPNIIFAYRRTGMIVSESNQDQWSAEDLLEWDAAIDAFFALEAKAAETKN